MPNGVKAVTSTSSSMSQIQRQPSSGSMLEGDVVQPVLVFAEHLGDAGDGEDVARCGHGQAASAQPAGRPVPGQQLVEPGGGVIGDAGEDVGEPGLRVDVVELGGDDQGVHEGGALTAAIGAGEEPGLAAEGDAAQRALGGVVGQADAAVVEEAGEARPSA